MYMQKVLRKMKKVGKHWSNITEKIGNIIKNRKEVTKTCGWLKQRNPGYFIFRDYALKQGWPTVAHCMFRGGAFQV